MPSHGPTPVAAPLPLVLAAALCAGCVTADAELRADGSLRLALRYVPGRHATVQSERRRLGADGVVVSTLEPDDRFTVATLDARDVAAVVGAAAFHGASVDQRRADGAWRLDVRVPAPDATQRAYLAWVRAKQPDAEVAEVSLALPGPVLEADARAAIDGASVRWRVPLRDWETGDGIALWVRWRDAGAGGHSM